MKKILLFSAYDALSHRYWREGLVVNFPEHDWAVLTLPARYFRWRIRGNSLTWAFSEQEVLSQTYDLVIATSMTDLATLRGLVPSLAQIPSIVYFHENQFAYPEGDHKQHNVEAKMVTIYSALTADKVVFNSDYNRQTFLEGSASFLGKMPDGIPVGVCDQIAQKAVVLPVPLNEPINKPNENIFFKKKQSSFTILWNHRWEYDKAPERFLQALIELKERKVDFKLNMLGQQFRQMSAVFDQMKENLSDHIQNWGFVESEEAYRSIMIESDVVVSSALHDFQGLSILEAVICGCVPVVPDRLAYREFIADQFRYESYFADKEKEVQELADHLERLSRDYKNNKLIETPDLSKLCWGNLKEKYRQEFFSQR
ncbi:MAG: DUF3524 domain-containing protein [Gammaproteobacteria bacterium]